MTLVHPESDRLQLDAGEYGDGVQVLRLVIDGVQECNLRCLYCHPGKVWLAEQLGLDRIRSVFDAAERYGCLEVVISGGEITLHGEFGELLDATHVFDRSASTLITNATRLGGQVIGRLARSNLTRICTSLDGVDNQTHGSARGRNLRTVLAGLERLQGTGKPITVITVVHRKNFQRVCELSFMLAERGLASQHHLCAPSYSGTAREHYDDLKLRYDDYFAVQRALDEVHHELRARGLYVTFNSFWPATGERPTVVNGRRTMTLQQLSEQVKDTLVNVRPNGEFRLNAATWGREMVGNAVIGNVHDEDPLLLLEAAERCYRDGSVGQLPREVEAAHKFQVGDRADAHATDSLIDSSQAPSTLIALGPIRPLSSHWLLDNPLDRRELTDMATTARRSPGAVRAVRHPSGAVLLFDKARSQLALLTEAEWRAFAVSLASSEAGGGR